MEQLALFTGTMKRSDVRTLDQAPEIYAVLSVLKPGDDVPACVYIADYADTDEIPAWQVREIEVIGLYRILTIIDSSTRKTRLDGTVAALAHEVFTAPGKSLRAPLYLWSKNGNHRRDMYADIRQHARQKNERRIDDDDAN